MSLSGEQIEITSGAQRVVVATVGATLRAYEVGSRPVIDGFGADEVCPGGRGQILMPWPNRIADGRYELVGRPAAAADRRAGAGPCDPRPGPLGASGRSSRRGPRRGVALRHRLCARPGYPFPLDLSVEYRLSPAGLAVTFVATNVGKAPCPFGAGAHPYFVLRRRRASTRWSCACAPTSGSRWTPARSRERDARSRAARSISGVRASSARPALDHAFTHLERDREGLAQVLLRHGGARDPHLAGPVLRLRTGLHRRHPSGSGATSPGRGSGADELRAERVQQRRRTPRAGPRANRSRVAGASRRERQAARARLRERVLTQRSPRSRSAGGVLGDPRLVSVRHVRADAARIHPAARARSSGHRRRSSDRAARRRQAGRVDPCRDHRKTARLATRIDAALRPVDGLGRASDGLATALNRAYEVPETRAMWRVRLRALVVTLVGVIASMVAATAMLVGPELMRQAWAFFGLHGGFDRIWASLRWPMAVLAMTSMLAFVYSTCRTCASGADRSYRDRSSPCSGVCWRRSASASTSRTSASTRAHTAALGTVVVLLLWLYLWGLMIIVGGQVNATLDRLRRHIVHTVKVPAPPRRRGMFVLVDP